MGKPSSFSTKLIKLREDRGWTVYGACQHMPNVGRETLTRLESGEANPSLVAVQTCLDLLHAYYPQLDLGDFTEDPELNQFTWARSKPHSEHSKRTRKNPRKTA